MTGHDDMEKHEAFIRRKLKHMHDEVIALRNEAKKGVQQNWDGFDVQLSNMEELLSGIERTMEEFKAKSKKRREDRRIT